MSVSVCTLEFGECSVCCDSCEELRACCVDVVMTVVLRVSGVECVEVSVVGVWLMAVVLVIGVCGSDIWLIGVSEGRLSSADDCDGVGDDCDGVVVCRECGVFWMLVGEMFNSVRPTSLRKLFMILR